ncbi:MAG: substrate-binding domain-containing protein, partial [Hoeflea sp.]|nr:substrate-binding domain-containing protein [Hoeflea sp.]
GVRCDNAAGGRLIAEAFLAAGAKSFAMITGDPKGSTSQDRVRGFVERLQEEGVKRSDITEVGGQSSYEGAFNAALGIFRDKDRPRPEALFAINDIMAMGAIDALRYRLGLRIPEDLMVAGFDDIPEGRRAPYQLTTVRQPINQMIDATLSILNLDDPSSGIEPGIDQPISGRLIWRNTIPVPAGHRWETGKEEAARADTGSSK